MADALPTAEIAVRAGVDWLEVGTPLILGEGLHAVAALHQKYPESSDRRRPQDDGRGLSRSGDDVQERRVVRRRDGPGPRAHDPRGRARGARVRRLRDGRRHALPRQGRDGQEDGSDGRRRRHRAHRPRRAPRGERQVAARRPEDDPRRGDDPAAGRRRAVNRSGGAAARRSARRSSSSARRWPSQITS